MPTVIFTENNARITKDPDECHAIRHWPNVLVNPDLKAVDGVAPHFWKVVGGRILPMTDSEQAARLAHISENGVKNAVIEMALPNDHGKNKWVRWVIGGLIATVTAYIMVKKYG